MPTHRLVPPILKLSSTGATAEVEQPDWWDAEQQRIFTEDGSGPQPLATFVGEHKRKAMAWRLQQPATGFLLSISDGHRNTLLWAESDPAYVWFATGIATAGLYEREAPQNAEEGPSDL